MKVFRHKCAKCGCMHEHIQGTTLHVTISKCAECGGKMERVIGKTDDANFGIKVSRSVSYASPSSDKQPYEPDVSFF